MAECNRCGEWVPYTIKDDYPCACEIHKVLINEVNEEEVWDAVYARDYERAAERAVQMFNESMENGCLITDGVSVQVEKDGRVVVYNVGVDIKFEYVSVKSKSWL